LKKSSEGGRSTAYEMLI